MEWKILTKVYDRIEAEMMKAALNALEIPVEIAQESVGGTIPVSFGAFAEIHVFVPKEKFKEASEWLETYEADKEEDPEE
jgi:propanediol dehydratase small subunit